MSLPLTLPAYNLDLTAYVQVTIVYNYFTADVSFYNEPVLVYSLTLLQQAPQATLPPNLNLGSMTIISGTLTMEIPSTNQPGTVTLEGVYTTEADKSQQTINAVIGTWTLNE